MSYNTFQINRSLRWASGTSVTVAYPSGTSAADYLASGHQLGLPGNTYLTGFTVTLGGSNITVTQNLGRTIEPSDTVLLSLATADAADAGAAAWGNITGTITDQTDLTSYVATAVANAGTDASVDATAVDGTLMLFGTVDGETPIQKDVDLVATYMAGKAPAQVAYAAAVDLTKSGGHMAAHTVAGAITFTAAGGAVDGGSCMLKITANGTNTPDFSAFTKVGDASWVNTNAVVNIVQFFRVGGTNYYSVAQAA